MLWSVQHELHTTHMTKPLRFGRDQSSTVNALRPEDAQKLCTVVAIMWWWFCGGPTENTHNNMLSQSNPVRFIEVGWQFLCGTSFFEGMVQW